MCYNELGTGPTSQHKTQLGGCILPSDRSRSSSTQDRAWHELTGVAVATSGAIVLIGLISNASGYQGPVPSIVSVTLQTMFGCGAYVAAIACVVGGALHAATGWRPTDLYLWSGLGVLFICFLTASHSGLPADALFETDVMRLGGGAVGAALAWGLLRAFGPVCRWVVLAGVLLCGSLLATRGGLGVVTRHVVAALVIGVRWVSDSTASVVVARRAARRPRKSAVGARRLHADGTSVRRSPEIDLDRDDEPQAVAPSAAPTQEVVPAATDSLPSRVAAVGGRRREERPPPKWVPPKRRAARSTQAEQLALISSGHLHQLPSPSLLSYADDTQESSDDRETAQQHIQLLEETLESFGIQARVLDYVRGPTITRYEVEPVRGIRVSRITKLADDLQMALAAHAVRVEAPVPGKSVIGIEVPNKHVAIVGLRSLLEHDEFRNHPSKLAVALGRDIAGTPVIADLGRMPHLLIAGATNSGKTVCLHSIIMSLVMRARPDEVRFILTDPKRVELLMYDGIPHLIAPVLSTARQAADVLRKAIREMEKRYDLFALKGVVNIAEYNELAAMPKESEIEDFDPLPYIVVIIDELADLLMQAKAEFEFSICRLAQLARATGIHLVVATQRPSTDVITGLIKANISSRIAFTVASSPDSRTILDRHGAERLIGRGDMLFAPLDASKPRRVQGAFAERCELERVVEFLRDQGEPDYQIVPDVVEEEDAYAADTAPSDELFASAVQLVAQAQEASVSMLQRRFKIGYARAGRLIDLMERRGIIGPSEGSKARQVLVPAGFVRGSEQSGPPTQKLAEGIDPRQAHERGGEEGDAPETSQEEAEALAIARSHE